ncbi:transporter substrate-binding domain-containing protein [Devosia sp.]|uniref:transporter substrate-binding domain-containing protein n=1 Tax=Devosia sp. TaxID=1871048 RepID=UPI002F1707EA
MTGLPRLLRRLSLSAKALAGALVMTGLSLSAAAALTPAELAAKNKLVVGVLVESIPWGFLDEKGEPAGYDPDVAQLLARELGVADVEFVRLAVASRIPQLLSGKIDIAVSILGMFPDRAKAIQFSKPYGVQQQIVMGRKDVVVDDLADLAALKVGVTKGSAQDVALTTGAPEGTEILRFDDDVAGMQALIAGHVDVIGGASTYMLNIEQMAPGQFEQKLVLSKMYMGVGLRPDDKELHAAVNAAIDRLIASGELNAVAQKWLKHDLPEMPTEIEGVPFN